MAANLITIDSSPYSALAVCHAPGCGWRSPVFRTRDRALASARGHRRELHPKQAADAARKQPAADQVAAA